MKNNFYQTTNTKYKYLLAVFLLLLTGCKTVSNQSSYIVESTDLAFVSENEAHLIALMDAGVGEDELLKQDVCNINAIYAITFSTAYGQYAYQINDKGQIKQVDWYLDGEYFECLQSMALTDDEAVEMIESKLNQVTELDYQEIDRDGRRCLEGSCLFLQGSCHFVLDLQMGLFLEWHIVND